MRRLPWGRQVAVARAVVLLAPAAFLGLVHGAGGQLSPGWLLVAGLGIACARSPDTAVPLASWALLGVVWVIAVTGFSWLAVPAALVGLAAHAATAFVAGAPPDAAVDRTLGLLWLRRLATVSAATAVVAVLARSLSTWSIPGSSVLTAITLTGVGGWLLVLGRGDPSPDP